MKTPPWRRHALTLLVAASPVILLLGVLEERGRARRRPPAGPEPLVRSRVERCLLCHSAEARSLEAAHSAEALGCSSCHLGNPLALDADRAHAGLERFPGDLSTAPATCGREGCHPDALRRVEASLMAEPRGLVSVNRFAFGELPTPDGDEAFPREEIWPRPISPANAHARKLCASCHLNTRHISKRQRARGGGCSACHLRPGKESDAHPQLLLGASSEPCVGCHSRSGRVALSFWGWHEGAPHPDHPPRSAPAGIEEPKSRRLPDGRLVRLARSDVHAAAGMGCTDCHTAVGLMGDGRRYSHKEEQVDVSCEDCHGPVSPGAQGGREALERREAQGGQGARQWAHGGPARPSRLSARDIEALRIERLLRGGRGRKPGDPVARTSRGTPLGALFMKPSGTWVLGRRVDGRELSLRPTPADAAHRLPGHERLGCQACHTAWTHQCAACHTRLEPAGEQWDNVVGARTAGRWVETGGDMRIDRPTLGIDPRGRIGPFIPGMPLVAAFGDVRISRRLFAPADPHTTTREARPCASCHADPLALGLGRGRLWRLDGSWHFEPAPPPEASSTAPIPAWPDGVPWDGWTGPQGPGLAEATRTGARPFGPGELRRVLDVSLCLPCHGRYDDPLYKDYRGGLERLRSGEAPRCAGPREP